MQEGRRILRQNRLRKYARILSDRYNLEVIVKDNIPCTSYACTDTTRKIYVQSIINNDKFMNLILHKGLTLHEIGHVLFTSSTAWDDIDKNISSILEDGRIEEAMSRMFPKSRLYFIYINHKLLHPNKIEEETGKKLIYHSLSTQVMQLIFRTSKQTTGIPPLPRKVKENIQENIGNDNYNWIVEQTKKSVNAKTDKESADIGKKIEKKLKEILNMDKYDTFYGLGLLNIIPNAETSIEKSGSTSQKMPKPLKEDENVINQVIDELQKETDKEEHEDSDEEDVDDFDFGDIDKETESNGSDLNDTDNDSDDLGGNESNGSDLNDTDNDLEDESFKIGSLGAPSFSVDEEYLDDEYDDADSDIPLIEKISKQIEEEIETELMNESDLLKLGDIESQFDDYGVSDGGNPFYGKYEQKPPINVNSIESVANRMSHLFRMIAQSGNGWNHNKTRGRLEIHKLTTLLASSDQPRIFKKKEEKEKIDLSAIILLDSSGSMKSICKEATQAAYIVSRALEINNYQSEVVAFGVKSDWRYNHDIFGLKSFNQKLAYAKDNFKAMAIDGTPLLSALIGAERSIRKVESKRKIIFVVTDGEPNEPKLCKTKINQLEIQGIQVVGVLLSYKDQHQLFHESRAVICNDIYQLPYKMGDVIKKILIKISV